MMKKSDKSALLQTYAVFGTVNTSTGERSSETGPAMHLSNHVFQSE